MVQTLMKYRRLIVPVLLPFAAGYFLSYFYRTINAVISAELSATMHLRASDLGLLTTVYFLVWAFFLVVAILAIAALISDRSWTPDQRIAVYQQSGVVP
jgi:sugar phosphate permease